MRKDYIRRKKFRMQNRSSHDSFRLRTLWLCIGWALVLMIVYLSLAAQPIPLPGEHGDKIGHLAAYAVLMLWFVQLYSGAIVRRLLALAFVALGVGLEFAQLLTDTRTFDVADMAADSLGVAIGWLVAPPRTINILRWVESVIC
jgi:VanZ family protein